MGDNKKKKNSGVVVAFWIVVALGLLIIFLVKRNTILEVLQNTEFFGKVFGTEPEFVVSHESKEKKQPLAELIITEETVAPVIILDEIPEPLINTNSEIQSKEEVPVITNNNNVSK